MKQKLIKLLALCALASFVHVVKSQNDDVMEVVVTNYDAMYDNECASTSSSSSDDIQQLNNDADDYATKYDKYYKKYAEKYEHKYEHYADKYEHEYSGASNPGSVPGNEIGGDDDSDSEKNQSEIFCKCMEKVKQSGKSYSESQNDFSKCIDKANGNDAKHWENVAKKYEHKFEDKLPDSWNLMFTSTEEPMDAVDVGSFITPAQNDNFGNAAIYITFIGTSLFIFVCAWFIKDGLKRWKLREYQSVKGTAYDSEADADMNGNPYGANYDDDWDDHYNSNYTRNQKSEKNGKFAGWNQYSAV